MFEDLVRHMTTQRSESDHLRRQLQSATNTIVLQNAGISTRIQETLEEERRQAADDRQKLIIQISALVNAQAETQETRLTDKVALIQKNMADSNNSLEEAVTHYGQGMETWDEKEGELLDDVKKTRDQMKTKLKDDWTAANEYSSSIQNTAKTVHAETLRVVDEQIKDLDMQMEALDDFVTRAKSENGSHHETHAQSVQALTNTVEQSFGNISAHFKTTFDRVKNLGEEVDLDLNDLQDGLEPLEGQLCQPLSNLREAITSSSLQEYQPTGETPAKIQYRYPTQLPRTEAHDILVSKIDEVSTPVKGEYDSLDQDNTIVFADLDRPRIMTSPPRPSRNSMASSVDKLPLSTSLREVNPNTTNLTGCINFGGRASTVSMPPEHTMPLLKRNTRATRSTKKQSLVGEGPENMLPPAFEPSASRRKSPRLS